MADAVTVGFGGRFYRLVGGVLECADEATGPWERATVQRGTVEQWLACERDDRDFAEGELRRTDRTIPALITIIGWLSPADRSEAGNG